MGGLVTVSEAEAAQVRAHMRMLNEAGWSWAAIGVTAGMSRSAAHLIATDPQHRATPAYASAILALTADAAPVGKHRAPNGRPKTVELVCLRCTTKFTVIAYQGDRRFCSQACAKAVTAETTAAAASERYARIAARYEAGEKVASIQAAEGCPRSAVYRALNRFGVPRRQPQCASR